MTLNENCLIIYLTLQEEEDSGLNEVGVGTLSASPLGGTFLLWFPLAEQSLRVLFISLVSHKSTPPTTHIILQLLFLEAIEATRGHAKLKPIS